MEIGWILLRTHFGVVITGNRSVRWRTISKDAEPDPITMPACSTTVSTPDSIRILATLFRDCRCRERSHPAPPGGRRGDRRCSRSPPSPGRAATPRPTFGLPTVVNRCQVFGADPVRDVRAADYSNGQPGLGASTASGAPLGSMYSTHS